MGFAYKPVFHHCLLPQLPQQQVHARKSKLKDTLSFLIKILKEVTLDHDAMTFETILLIWGMLVTIRPVAWLLTVMGGSNQHCAPGVIGIKI